MPLGYIVKFVVQNHVHILEGRKPILCRFCANPVVFQSLKPRQILKLDVQDFELVLNSVLIVGSRGCYFNL